MKDAFYFPHDYNARNDERIMYILSKYGVQGYGIYWFFVEQLHDEPNSKLKCSLLEVYAFQWHVKKNLLLRFYDDAIEIGLFETDGECFWSNRVFRNKDTREEKRLKKSEAGKLGMAKRWDSDNSVITDDNSVITEHNSVITEHNKGKETGKEILKEKKGDLERKGNIESKPCPDSDGDVDINSKKAAKKAEQKRHYDFVGKRFEEFWKAYPRREARKDAEKAFRKIFAYEIPDGQCTTRIKNLGVLTSRLIKEGRERKHVPLPATFLNREDFDIKPEVIEDSNEVEWVEVEEN